MRLAGPQRCHDAYKCIKVRGDDGLAGVTLATWLNRSKQQRHRPAAAAGGPADPRQQQAAGQKQQERGGGEAAGSSGGGSSSVVQQQGLQAGSRGKRVRFQLDGAADTSGHEAAAAAAATDGGGDRLPAKRGRYTVGTQQQLGCKRDHDDDGAAVAGLMAAHNSLFEAAWRLGGSGCDAAAAAAAAADESATAMIGCGGIISPGAAELLVEVEAFLWQQAAV